MPDKPKIDPDARDYAAMAVARNQLFMRRFGRQAPGHSEPMETSLDSNEDENIARVKEWHSSGQQLGDALEYIYKLMREVEGLEEKIEDLEIVESHHQTLIDAAREMAKKLVNYLEQEFWYSIDTLGDVWKCCNCNKSAQKWRNIKHDSACSIAKDVVALLTLEALLPKENADG